jgi:hypothetical protein
MGIDLVGMLEDEFSKLNGHASATGTIRSTSSYAAGCCGSFGKQ